MRKLLIPLLAAFALPNAVFANDAIEKMKERNKAECLELGRELCSIKQVALGVCIKMLNTNLGKPEKESFSEAYSVYKNQSNIYGFTTSREERKAFFTKLKKNDPKLKIQSSLIKAFIISECPIESRDFVAKQYIKTIAKKLKENTVSDDYTFDFASDREYFIQYKIFESQLSVFQELGL